MKAKRIVVIPKKYQTHKRCEAMLKSTDQNRRCSHKEKSNGLCGLHLKSSSVVRWYDFIDDEQLWYNQYGQENNIKLINTSSGSWKKRLIIKRLS